MFRHCPRVIALTAMVAAAPITATADSTLTLACQGTASVGKTAERKPEEVSLGIIVNFTQGTVHGLASFPANITGADETRVSFSGSQPGASIDGTIDRVTGDAEATFIMNNTKTHDILLMTIYALKCRPAERMF